MTARGTRRAAATAAVAALVAGYLVVCARDAWVCDDALIAFRHAENAAAGHGPVFNPGERVEGFSSPLHMGLLTLAAALGADLFAFSGGLGLICGALELLVLIWAARRWAGVWPAALAAGLFITDRVVVVWTTGGLETSLHGGLVLAGFCAAVGAPASARGAAALGGIHAAVALSRPEGISLMVPALAIYGLRHRRDPRLLRSLLLAAAVVGAIVAAATAARLAYYGRPLPNPYYVKVAGLDVYSQGAGYLAGFAIHAGWLVFPGALLWLALAAAAVLARVRGRGRAPALAVAGWAAGYLAFALAVVGVMGGDYMPAFRLLRPMCGVLYLGVAALAAAAVDWPSRPRLHRGLAAGLVAALVLAAHLGRQRESMMDRAERAAATTARINLTRTPEQAALHRHALLAVMGDGEAQLTWVSGLGGYGHTIRTIDATGLVSPDVGADFPPRIGGDGEPPLAGHGRWPSADYLARERFALLFPYVSLEPPTRTTDLRPTPPAVRDLLLVTVPQASGTYFRFRTTLELSTLEARAAQRGLFMCAWDPVAGVLHCFGRPWWPDSETCARLERRDVVDALQPELRVEPTEAAAMCMHWRSRWQDD